MTDELDPGSQPNPMMVYRIRIKGHLDREWADWFDGMTVTLDEHGETLLSGPVVDQAALYGLLRKVRDLGMALLAVQCVEGYPDEAQPSQLPEETALGTE